MVLGDGSSRAGCQVSLAPLCVPLCVGCTLGIPTRVFRWARPRASCKRATSWCAPTPWRGSPPEKTELQHALCTLLTAILSPITEAPRRWPPPVKTGDALAAWHSAALQLRGSSRSGSTAGTLSLEMDKQSRHVQVRLLKAVPSCTRGPRPCSPKQSHHIQHVLCTRGPRLPVWLISQAWEPPALVVPAECCVGCCGGCGAGGVAPEHPAHLPGGAAAVRLPLALRGPPVQTNEGTRQLAGWGKEREKTKLK